MEFVEWREGAWKVAAVVDMRGVLQNYLHFNCGLLECDDDDNENSINQKFILQCFFSSFRSIAMKN
jgi:hypothetical protein